MTYINARACRRFLLDYAKQNRAHRFVRVSKETLEQLDARVRTHMVAHVQSFPSKGKTL